ncbi:MOSC domain-containing protein [Actinoplanes sp. Pm04-4]|uniref:MOSC domain-containing protein n=1 Tax=Paractinoplanes pyxinae TaxID=2997416 RepID=A0ABT4AUB5_9ACTN|nr:MOSC domain-containing protein [Actinoplanes pyxinae]MCY1137777.1 MOSC domain-containing protein [Actinoplanes pyxinae]
MTDGKVLSVNVGVARPNPAKRFGGVTGIDKLPVEHAVDVRAPGPKTTGLHSGVIGDPIGDVKNHGGDDQAVYAYSREDYDWWEASLGRPLANGWFGENMTTTGLDLNATRIGEVWRIGDTLELQPTFGRIPCMTFQVKMGEKKWLKRFAQAARTGTYLRVITPGPLRVGDPIEIVHRPARSIGVSEAFDIYMHRSEELARILEAEALPAGLREELEHRLARR